MRGASEQHVVAGFAPTAVPPFCNDPRAQDHVLIRPIDAFNLFEFDAGCRPPALDCARVDVEERDVCDLRRCVGGGDIVRY